MTHAMAELLFYSPPPPLSLTERVRQDHLLVMESTDRDDEASCLSHSEDSTIVWPRTPAHCRIFMLPGRGSAMNPRSATQSAYSKFAGCSFQQSHLHFCTFYVFFWSASALVRSHGVPPFSSALEA